MNITPSCESRVGEYKDFVVSLEVRLGECRDFTLEWVNIKILLEFRDLMWMNAKTLC